jgi:hypothetical protein
MTNRALGFASTLGITSSTQYDTFDILQYHIMQLLQYLEPYTEKCYSCSESAAGLPVEVPAF